MAAFKPRSLLFTLQPRYVYTVSDALGQVTHINKCSKHLPKTLPRHFVLSAFLLHQRYVAQENNIINHKIMLKPGTMGTLTYVAPKGNLTIEDTDQSHVHIFAERPTTRTSRSSTDRRKRAARSRR